MRGHSENGISYSENGISNSESCSENAPELSESSENGAFTQSIFPEIGVVPRLLMKKIGIYRSIQIDYRQTFFLGGINFQLQIQNPAARRINLNYRDRSVGI